ncbi:MAG: hypothetical protein JNM65_08235 [Verrucomicrobiaceae bacterium]|nr:hypothetical protein [Verrucomicrobiaceae bacterium]
MSHVIYYRSKEEIDRDLLQMKSWARKNLRTRKQSRDFLIKAGILDKQGVLSKRYGGKGE